MPPSGRSERRFHGRRQSPMTTSLTRVPSGPGRARPPAARAGGSAGAKRKPPALVTGYLSRESTVWLIAGMAAPELFGLACIAVRERRLTVTRRMLAFVLPAVAFWTWRLWCWYRASTVPISGGSVILGLPFLDLASASVGWIGDLFGPKRCLRCSSSCRCWRTNRPWTNTAEASSDTKPTKGVRSKGSCGGPEVGICDWIRLVAIASCQ
jgi:hypothetical protein